MRLGMRTTLLILITIFSAGTLRSQAKLGDFTFTYGFESRFKPRHEDEGDNNQRLKASLRIVLAPNVSFTVANVNLVSNQNADGTRSNGIGATSLGFSAKLVTEDATGISKRPAVAAKYQIILPTASKSLGNFRGTKHAITLAISKSFGPSAIVKGSVKRRHVFEVDLGEYLAEKEAGGYSKTPELTLAFSRVLDSLANQKYVYGNELYMSAPTKDNLSEISILNQLTIQLNSTSAFSSGIRVGLTPNSPRVAFFGSISFDGSFR